ncbi:hypothetical protein [Streptomyces sp. MUM 178J]|uniref:hypothetical protein n=1 Tax=Streptomyces sp. MUM 178J TaxID=2791991 RepID=UPI001F04E694|nr:hypothetical protein [Streptomyces sp. MUM 178J]WRQ79572.1 hypothetical protein I3F59_009475 [Streptomyces sp. MUM 178J]
MRSALIALRGAGVAGVLIIAPATPAAYAADPVKATPTPAAVAPGGKVEVRVSGCPEAGGAVSSKAFVADAELAADGSGSELIGSTTVKSTAEADAYDIEVDCGGREHPSAGRIEIVHRYARPHPSRQPGQSPQARPSAGGPQASSRSPSPVAPVRAGGGGAATLAGGQAAEQPSARPDVAETGPGTPHTVIGLVLAGVAAVAVAFRSARRRRSGTD